MKIELTKITIGELVDGYKNDAENGVTGFHGLLDIRPAYQREFIYNDKQQKSVIETIKKGYPLNVMYWVKNPDGRYELLDGQQRTMSICQFNAGNLWVEWNGDLVLFSNLHDDQKNLFLNYELTVYVCSDGTDSEKLEWFKTINIAGEELTEQEIRNAVYSGAWVTDLKKKFAKTNCVGYLLAKDYLSGSSIRQDYLETVIDWISRGEIEKYMSIHQNDKNGDVEWQYFQNVINWVKTLFTTYRKEMKGLPWGELYNKYETVTRNNPDFTATKIEEKIRALIDDEFEEVQDYKGIYKYVFTGDWHDLLLRAFDKKTARKVYEKQNGLCAKCGNHFELEHMEADHITPWAKGGHTVIENCQMLCRDCNRRKSDS